MNENYMASNGKTPRIGISRCFGTFGELVQGELPNGNHFLVTLPIALYSTVQYVTSSGQDIRVFPPYKTKSKRLAEQLIRARFRNVGGTLFIHSELPEGKGLASSSADLVATAAAIQKALDFSIHTDELAELMASIEPSDGVMYEGVVSFYHREGVLRRYLGRLPDLAIVAVDEGGRIDTVEFNLRRSIRSATQRAEYYTLLSCIEQAILRQDIFAIGDSTTRSAIMNQDVLPKSNLGLFLDLRERYHALGVVVAHSGTYIGLLLNPKLPAYAHQLAGIVSELSVRTDSLQIFHTHTF